MNSAIKLNGLTVNPTTKKSDTQEKTISGKKVKKEVVK